MLLSLAELTNIQRRGHTNPGFMSKEEQGSGSEWPPRYRGDDTW